MNYWPYGLPYPIDKMKIKFDLRPDIGLKNKEENIHINIIIFH